MQDARKLNLPGAFGEVVFHVSARNILMLCFPSRSQRGHWLAISNSFAMLRPWVDSYKK